MPLNWIFLVGAEESSVSSIFIPKYKDFNMDPSRSPLSLLVVLILLAAMVQTQAASKTSASAKADLLRRRAMASPDYVIRFDSKDFQYIEPLPSNPESLSREVRELTMW